jgi:UDP-N-acetylglucosamine acyltransferase
VSPPAEPECACGVILMAVQAASGSARMSAQITEVFPAFRLFPPTAITTAALQRLEARADLLELFAHLRQPAHIREHLQVLLERPRGRAPHHLSCADHLRRQHTAARAQHRALFNARLVADAYLPADDRVVLDNYSSREARLRGDDDVPADAAVVRDVNHVVELDAVSDLCNSQRRAVDARVRADLDIIADSDAPDLRELLVVVARERKTEPVRADDASRVQHGAAADRDVVIDCDARMQHAILAQRDAAAYRAPRPDAAARADTRASADGNERPDFGSVRDCCAGIDNRRWVYAGSDGFGRVEARDGARERGSRLGGADKRAPVRVRKCRGRDEATRGGTCGLARSFLIADKREVAWAGGVERGSAKQFLFSVAFVRRAEPLGEFTDEHVTSYGMPIDPSAVISPTARVHPDASIGPGTVVGDYCVIEENVAIGAGCRLEPYVYIKRWTTLGDGNEISAGAALGTDPFDKAFTGERSYLRIGNGNRIREHFTISRGTKPESETVIGDGNFIMSSGHIAHNARVGNDTVIASSALLAGYVEVGDQAFISGNVSIHQYSKIGRLAIVGGNSAVNLDLPPFITYVGLRARPVGLNIVGLKRAGFTAEDISALKRAYKLLYRSGLKLADALARIESEIATGPALELVEFCRASKRGIAREQAREKWDR